MVEARPYQLEAIEAIEEEIRKGVRDTLCVMATGTGKTFIFLGFIKIQLEKHPEWRFLITAHLDELINQPIERMEDYYPEIAPRMGIVMAENDSVESQIIVATVQTLSYERRIENLLSAGKIDCLVVDEAQHSVSITYRRIIERLKSANPDMVNLGVTATPYRADKKGLVEIYKSVAYVLDILDGIKGEWLAPIRWLVLQVDVSLKGISSSNGDYSIGKLANIFETSNSLDLIVRGYQDHGENRKAIFFTVSVKGAYDLAEKFNAAGIPAIAADGKTSKKERKKILHDFRSGKYQILVNVGLYTEGFDAPEVSCIGLARPTQSDGLCIQMIGRGLRKFPGKSDCLVLDFAPKDGRNLVAVGDILGLKERKKRSDGEPGEIIGGGYYDGKHLEYIEGDPNNLFAKVVDYLNISPWSWYKDDRGWMSLDLGRSGEFSRVLMISPLNDSDEFTLFGIAKKYEEVDDKERIISEKVYRLNSGAWDAIEDKAGDLIRKSGNPAMAKRNKEWRGKPPTTAQINFAQRLKVFVLGDDRGTMSAKITAEVSYRALKKHGMI